jgi:hypothetical protein
MPESREFTPPAGEIEAAAMREYDDYGEYRDDHIRLYTPVLQRVIILTAVIIAVPVLMWTVTTFVRSYVARPKVPVLQHVATSESQARGPVASPAPSIPAQAPTDQAAAAPPRGDTALALSGARTPDPKKGPPIAPASGDATASAPAVQGDAPPPIPAKPVQGSSPTAAVSPAGAAAGSTAPAAAAASPIPTTPRPAENAAAVAPSSSSDRGFAWPNPNSTSPPSFGPPAAATPTASTPPPLPRTATAEVLPPGEPVRGPIPLPRQRPTVYAVAAVASSGPVPVPRVRPSDAPAETTLPVGNAPNSYDPGLAGH